MKIMTICGTRPELIRLSRIISKLDKVCEHILVYTNQNYDPKLKDIFFEELGIRDPNYILFSKGSLGMQVSIMFPQLEDIITREKPDKALILGDTNSGLCAIICERMKVPVYHMEAGNRCFDRDVPEELNRHVIDSVSSYNLPYTKNSAQNLIKEGFSNIYVTGNPIREVIQYNINRIDNSKILEYHSLTHKNYILATLHRSENVDNQETFLKILQAYNFIAQENCPVIVSVHPRTQSKLNGLKIYFNINVRFYEPFGFFDFVQLEQHARYILTDSGTVQEEACILHVPCIVTRKSTERMETIECGATDISGIETGNIIQASRQLSPLSVNWTPPKEYLDLDVSGKIIKILKGEYHVQK
jgi:UDP-N-acetylglucosamine 2-epimerase (non-hydrolysing)